MTQRVLAQATVDDLGHGQFEVHVQGDAPYDHRRVYTLSALSDNKAAFKGIEMFVDEMTMLYEGSTLNGHAPAPDPAPTTT